MVHKFKVGDRVKCDGMGYAEVLDLLPATFGDICPNYRLRLESNDHIMVIEEIWIRLLMPKLETKCECGAHHTSAPDDHLQYCPKYIKVTL